MGISPYLAGLRAAVGHALLLVPSAAALVWDEQGRLLLVRDIHSGRWQTLGGALDPDESPQQAAVREAFEESGAEIEITGIRAAIGGPHYRLRYHNGDEVAYVASVFDARMVGGSLRPDGEETSEVAWFDRAELAELALTDFTRSMLRDVGVLDAD